MEKFEEFTADDLAKLHELQSRQKRVNRLHKQIIDAITNDEELRKQVVEALHINSDFRLETAAKLYNTDTETLYQWITEDRQINAFLQRQNVIKVSDAAINEEQIEESDDIEDDNSIEENVADNGNSIFYR